ncbi:type VI secretion system tube protein Hcp [Tatumella sp. UBA2305]|uniref:type VI secretion system tube protein Hcp n=1 Tax=Tatumella sp. UBA2305 TaxID=1947647 RepID=UPI0032E455E4
MLDSVSPYLFTAAAPGQSLKSAEFRFYHINYAGHEDEYYRITMDNVKVIAVSSVMYDTRECPGTGHQEEVALDMKRSPIFIKTATCWYLIYGVNDQPVRVFFRD